MTLQQALADYRAGAMSRTAPSRQQQAQDAIDILKASGAEARVLGRGQRAPEFSLPDAHGRQQTLHEHLARGAVVLVFYRGGWCPYCNLTLRAWLAQRAALREAGAELIAISPESPDRSLDTAQRNALDFPVLSDRGNHVAERFGLVFELDAASAELYRQNGVDLAHIHGETTARLPMPAVLLIEPRGSIVMAQVDADYRQRLEPSVVLQALRKPGSV